MEISNLNFEIISEKTLDLKLKGIIIFDPLDHNLVFYDQDDNILMSKKIDSISVIPHYLKQNKIAFYDDKDLDSLITISCDKKETLNLKSFRYILARILTNQEKKAFKEKSVDSKSVITKPKDYQIEILEIAKEKNTIVFLETGLGKTYIAVLLIKHLYGEPIQSNNSLRICYEKKNNKKVIFLFKTVSLLLQQSKVLKNNTNLKILKLYGGQEGNNAPSYSKFRKIFERYDIICATPEIVYRYFTFGYLTIDDFSLIVIDECHHTKDKDYYNLILKHFIHPVDKNCNVKILGLTASPSFDNAQSEEKIAENIQTLCNNMNCYLACPSNIIENSIENSDKEICLINIDSIESDINNIIEIKTHIFKKVIFPFTSVYMKLKESNSYSYSNEVYDPLILCSLFLTLICEEEKISEKLNGIFEKKDFLFINNFYNQITSENQTFSGFSNNGMKTFLENFKNLSERTDIDNEKINYSREIRDFEKKTNDSIIKIIRKYVKNLNFIFKYTDSHSVYEYSMSIFQEIKNFYRSIFKDEEILNKCLYEIEKLNKFTSFVSNYLTAVENFFNDKINQYETNNVKSEIETNFDTNINTCAMHKSIIFVNQRIICKILNEKLNKFLKFRGNYSCKFVVGCQNSSSFPFSEEELKLNIGEFTINPKCIALIATNVVEEGIDIPQCNNVINLTEIRSIKEFIQKSGRARKIDSRIYLCCKANEAEEYKNKMKQIKMSIKVMKKIISENKLIPKVKNEKYIANLNYYQTNSKHIPARVYLPYAKKIVEEFVGKLFFDGYTYLKSQMKLEELVNESGKTVYRPYLSLPYVLESNFNQIFDDEGPFFETKDDARIYFSKYEDYFYLKAVKLLHFNNYLNEHLCFSKNYDELMNVENDSNKFYCEPSLKIKISEIKKHSENEYVEIVVHLLDITPGYIDLNYSNSNSHNYIAILSDKPLNFINFDIYLHSTQLIKLYYFNSFDEGYKSKFSKKPKIPFNVFTKLNVTMDKYKAIKINKKDLPLIDFLYTYILFSSTDAELFFYYCINLKKFDFADKLFLSDKNISKMLQFIFENFSHSLEAKKHLNDFKNAELEYSNHLIKISIVKFIESNDNQLVLDVDYIQYVLKCVKDDIKFYYNFIVDCVQSASDVEIMKIDKKYRDERTDSLADKRKDVPLPNCGILSRNMINYGKLFILNYGATDRRGTSIYTKTDNYSGKKPKNSLSKSNTEKESMDYQTHFLEKYCVLTDPFRDYKKCLPLDYNQKVLKYKVNLNQIGKVSRSFHKCHYLKKFQFLPNEVIQEIKFASMDQLYLFTLFPVIIYKTLNSFIYYYQAYCLKQRFHSFRLLDVLDLKVLTQALNSKSTLECENYERLEFLGDSILKFLSSFEVFKLYPEGNRDLLFSKRKVIENNKSLFLIGIENKIDEFLFTAPVTIKRIKIPGFNNDETLMFNIGLNRSFAKSCFTKLQNEKNGEEIIGEDITKYAFNNKLIPSDNGSKKNWEEIQDEEKTEKTIINIEYENNDDPYYKSGEILIDDNIIEEVVTDKIEIIPSKRFRILYHKVIADLVESLAGFLLHSSIYTEKNLRNMFIKSSIFFKEIGLLKYDYQEYLFDTFWLNNLLNKNCKFSDLQRNLKVKPISENKRYKFRNIELLYQACTHPSYLSDESMKANFPYVRKSYQRLAFLGEAFVSFYVSLWVYDNCPDANEAFLHKLKICGINHHIISLIAIDLKLDDCLLKNDRDIEQDLKNYKNQFIKARSQSDNIYKINYENLLDEDFMIILCEMFHAYIGAILLDSRDVEKTFIVIKEIMDCYLLNNATSKTYTEHPKVIILDEFYRRRNYLKKIRENGLNRINFKNEKGEKFRKLKLYKYQLIIDKFIIYEEYIFYNRSTIKIAQEKAKDIFLKICKEIDKREKLGLHQKFFDLENIIIHLGINYEKVQI